MPDHTNHGMQCNEFDSLLSDALDGVLRGAALDRFQAHARSCQACGPLFAEVEAGRNWLKDLEEAEPPGSLVLQSQPRSVRTTHPNNLSRSKSATTAKRGSS